METIKGYKGFDKDMKCRGFQFEEGKEYETDKAKACEAGFHACEYPLDIFNYYDPANSIFHKVEQSGNLDKNDGDSKVASTKIKIGVKIDFKAMIQDSFEYVKSRCTNHETGKDMSALNGGNKSALNGGYMSALNGGYMSALNGGDKSALNGGYMSALNGGDKSALNGGDESKLTGGKKCVVYGCGRDAQVRGDLGSVLALAEFDNEYNLIKVHVNAVEGKKIKANTFYKLQKGKFVEVE